MNFLYKDCVFIVLDKVLFYAHIKKLVGIG